MGRAKLPLVAVGLVLALVGAGNAAAGGNAGFAPPDSVSPSGSAINQLYWIIIGISAAIFLIVETLLIYSIVRFRRRSGARSSTDGPQIHGNSRLELVWTLIPVLIVIAIIAVTVVKVPAVTASPAPGSNPLVVQVEAHTFYWEYKYPNGVVAVDRLTLPVDRPIQLRLTGADVEHSWWVPQITGKKDAVPGRVNTLNFTVEKTGVYTGQCSAFCGVQHAIMYIETDVVPQPAFDRWLASQAPAQAKLASTLGRATWVGVCAKCHGLAGQGGYGPPIAGNATLADKRALSQLLAKGQNSDSIPGFMPPISGGWPEKQLNALYLYLQRSGIAPKPIAGQGG